MRFYEQTEGLGSSCERVWGKVCWSWDSSVPFTALSWGTCLTTVAGVLCSHWSTFSQGAGWKLVLPMWLCTLCPHGSWQCICYSLLCSLTSGGPWLALLSLEQQVCASSIMANTGFPVRENPDSSVFLIKWTTGYHHISFSIILNQLKHVLNLTNHSVPAPKLFFFLFLSFHEQWKTWDFRQCLSVSMCCIGCWWLGSSPPLSLITAVRVGLFCLSRVSFRHRHCSLQEQKGTPSIWGQSVQCWDCLEIAATVCKLNPVLIQIKLYKQAIGIFLVVFCLPYN